MLLRMMHTFVRSFLLAFCFAALAACSKNDPGPLAGTWQMTGLVPMTVQFRPGETEAMGIIEKVSYEVKGSDVIVTYENGLMKGSAVRFTMTGPNAARSELGNFQRIR